MKKALVVLVGILSVSGVAPQSTRGPLEGVWQTVEIILSGPDARTIANRSLRARTPAEVEKALTDFLAPQERR